jgi:hypothetical protein
MKADFLRQKVNFFISVFFIASFGVFMVTIVLQVAHASNPIITTFTGGAYGNDDSTY